MLEQLADSYVNKKPFNCTLQTCRPFTLVVDGAFESSKLTHGVDTKYLRRFEYQDSIKTVVDGLDEFMKKTFEQSKLFSELSVPWAIKTKPFDVTGYKQFPSDEINI